MDTVNRYRQRRGRLLARLIGAVAASLGRDIDILDVGGREDYWQNVPLQGVRRITLLNLTETELRRDTAAGTGLEFVGMIGDARDLSGVAADGSADFVHANSVIEHVGSWDDMDAMARELARVGQSGWVQTPAFAFPIEPHFRAPFLHWFGAPVRRRMLSLSPHYRHLGLAERRHHIDRINLLSKSEMQALFPAAHIYTERVLGWSKSYTAYWGPLDNIGKE